MRNFNLGTMFGRNDLGAGRDALQIVQESDERLAYFRGLGRNDSRLTALCVIDLTLPRKRALCLAFNQHRSVPMGACMIGIFP